MKILISGGAGFIGSHLVDALVARGHRCVVVDNLSIGKKENINFKARFYNVDVRNAGDLERVFATEHPDIVSHHAAQIGVRRSIKDLSYDADVNVVGSLHVLESCLRHRIRHLIFASTSAVYSESARLPANEDECSLPVSAYAQSKLVTEQYLNLLHRVYEMKYTAFRYGNVYGPRQDPHGEAGVIAIFCDHILRNQPPRIFGDGKKTRDYIHVSDVVEANLLAIEKGGGYGVMNLGWGRQTSDFEVFNAVRDTLGAHLEPEYCPRRIGELTRVCLDSSKAQSRLGWIPKICFEDGVASTVRWYHLDRMKEDKASSVEEVSACSRNLAMALTAPSPIR